MAKTTFATIDEYIDTFTPEVRRILHYSLSCPPPFTVFEVFKEEAAAAKTPKQKAKK